MVLVINGGGALRFFSLRSTSVTWNRVTLRSSAAICSAVFSSFIQKRSLRSVSVSGRVTSLSPSTLHSFALTFSDLGVSNSVTILQYSFFLYARISFSLSQTIRTATDWTLPADRPLRTTFQSRGLIL